MKKVVILGANGRSGREIISRLKNQKDVNLTLFLRQSERINDIKTNEMTVIDGDAEKYNNLLEAVQEKDIVINAMGGSKLGETTEKLVKAMEELNVKRIIAINAGGIYNELPEPFNTWDFEKVGESRPINLRAAEAIENSSLVYTIVRPVWLTNKQIVDFQLTKKGETYKGTETSRSSIAEFISTLVENPNLYLNENLGISQPNTDGDKPAAYS